MKTRLNLLIVDDDKNDRALYSRLLMHDAIYNVAIFSAETRQGGLDIVSIRDVDCVLLDYALPDANGLEVLKELKKDRPYLPVIMLTGQGDEELATEAMAAGAQNYLVKGRVTPTAIRSAIHNAIELISLKRESDAQREAIERFNHILAHDLKEPSRAISQFVGRFKKEYGESLEGNAGKYFEFIEDASMRMSQLIDALQEYITFGQPSKASEEVQFSKIVDNAISNLAVAIQNENAQITYDQLPVVTGYEALLTQLLQNLVGNAIKYCEADPKLVHVSAERLADSWRFSVKDNGIGIAKESDQKKIFELFTRLHGTSEYTGSGLGLSTCKNIVALHKGEIWCESEKDNGSVFYFTIPDN